VTVRDNGPAAVDVRGPDIQVVIVEILRGGVRFCGGWGDNNHRSGDGVYGGAEP